MKMTPETTFLISHMKQITSEILSVFLSISVLYIFGSHAAGKNEHGSDLDIAVFTDDTEGPTMDLELAAFLQQRLNRPVDVVILQRVSPILQHEVLSNKIRIYEKSPEIRAKMEVRSFRAYLDALHYQKKRYNRRNLDGQHSHHSTPAEQS
jgi:predicted nucleotidyltransferase